MKNNKGLALLARRRFIGGGSRIEGFTLIEMLVVIAVVGILSATVLTALGPARTKGRDARITSNLNQIAAVAEANFDGSDYPEITNAAIAELIADTKKFNGDTAVPYNLNTAKDAFAAWSALASDATKYFCVDSTGVRRVVSAPTAGSSACPST